MMRAELVEYVPEYRHCILSATAVIVTALSSLNCLPDEVDRDLRVLPRRDSQDYIHSKSNRAAAESPNRRRNSQKTRRIYSQKAQTCQCSMYRTKSVTSCCSPWGNSALGSATTKFSGSTCDPHFVNPQLFSHPPLVLPFRTSPQSPALLLPRLPFYFTAIPTPSSPPSSLPLLYATGPTT